jgi:hypothetical protein
VVSFSPSQTPARCSRSAAGAGSGMAMTSTMSAGSMALQRVGSTHTTKGRSLSSGGTRRPRPARRLRPGRTDRAGLRTPGGRTELVKLTKATGVDI